jgi:chromosome segregation protein
VLKLRRIEINGFKSFSDRGEILVNDSGVTAIVGPNGCGKSNVSDAIAWVLGEQSAKSLRGEKMEDVIFNGSRNRSAMGMAEVTITLTQLTNGNGNGNGNGHGNGAGATTPAVASDPSPACEEVQPAPQVAHGNGNGHGHGNGNGNGHGHGPHAGPRDIVVQRRLYRSGESVYLLDGKPCRLRDIQDIFLGTGLGPNSYAIIEQGRVGQLLSAKPSDRRGLIEEAAGITKFKAKRKLAESRLEAARQNLSRVNDILAEVDRQRNSLKRQAGKARRFIELRNRMRSLLGAVFSTRAEMLVEQQERVETALGAIGGEGKTLEAEIERLGVFVHQQRRGVEGHEHSLQEMRERNSELEVEHEKAVQRVERLHDQIHTLDERKNQLRDERQRALADLERNSAEQEARTGQQAEIEKVKNEVEQVLSESRARVDGLLERRTAEERAIEGMRRQQFDIVGREARINNEINSRKETINRIASQVARLDREETEAQAISEKLETDLNQAREAHAQHQASFVSLKTELGDTEQTLAKYKDEHATAVVLAGEARSYESGIRQRLQTIGELAVQRAYSTESVQQFFNHVRSLDWSPLGILADFVEVDPEYESVVEDFLKSELQFVVVPDRSIAGKALSIVKEVTKGRLNCLVLNGSTVPTPPETIDGATPLATVMRFDPRVQHFNEYIRDAYVVENAERAWELAEKHPHCKFVTRTGEIVRGHVIGWGEHDAHGPLSLKREIRELDRQLDLATKEAVARQEDVKHFEELIREKEALRARQVAELQELEKTILNMDHRVRSLSADWERSEQRRRVARAEIERFEQERQSIETSLAAAEAEVQTIAAEKSTIEQEIRNRAEQSEQLRMQAEDLRRELSELQAQLAVLNERRATVAREVVTLKNQAAELDERSKRAERQIQQADEQQDQTRAMIAQLVESRYEFERERETLEVAIAEAAARLEDMRRELHEQEGKWDETRALLDSWKDRHNALEIEKNQVDSDLKHLSLSCFNELNETIEATCLTFFTPLAAEELEASEHEYRDLREKVDSMGAVNMMAVDEYQEAEDRFQFLTTQRQDLLDSIRDTTQAIEEIDSVCRRQFKEAFEAINAGFKDAFVSLFGGGHGELRLLEEAGESDAGVEIVASPPGKKMQNVLLLSGGEKALTALSLLIALFRYKPSPFCILDEVDAPLDEANVDRFANMVRDMSSTTQFIVITHSKRTMETASALYGVTMEEPGISKIVSVRLN